GFVLDLFSICRQACCPPFASGDDHHRLGFGDRHAFRRLHDVAHRVAHAPHVFRITRGPATPADSAATATAATATAATTEATAAASSPAPEPPPAATAGIFPFALSWRRVAQILIERPRTDNRRSGCLGT